jgi:hypothetical protein
MSVTEGTGHVGNTFVEAEVKRFGEKKKSPVVAEAVGMWEGRGVLRAFQASVGREEKIFFFSSLSILASFP